MPRTSAADNIVVQPPLPRQITQCIVDHHCRLEDLEFPLEQWALVYVYVVPSYL